MWNFAKIRVVKVDLFHACRQMDGAYLSLSYSCLANARRHDQVLRQDESQKSGFPLVFIQGVPGGMDKTSGECSLC